MEDKKPTPEDAQTETSPQDSAHKNATKDTGKNVLPKEYKGYEDQGLLEPTRYGDWDVKGRCSDF